MSVLLFARSFAYRQAHAFICAYICLCENMPVYVRAFIGGLQVHWLELTYNCIIAPCLFIGAVVDTVFFVCICAHEVLLR